MNVTARLIAAVLALTAAGADASSISEYYNKECTGTVNSYFSGSTPNYCNTQTGASIGWTLDKACPLTFYSDKNCQTVAKTIASSKTGCQDFPSTGGSWLFHC
ncbi:hypothetical protein diail_8569 [Diaporthe ilicicola]|nr:hypothetical protein diail_8569 [Diaporthe ilicicola]